MNCHVLKGQMNVSFKKADSLLFFSWCGTDSISTWAWKSRPFTASSNGLHAFPSAASLLGELNHSIYRGYASVRIITEHPLLLRYELPIPWITSRTTWKLKPHPGYLCLNKYGSPVWLVSGLLERLNLWLFKNMKWSGVESAGTSLADLFITDKCLGCLGTWILGVGFSYLLVKEVY